MEQQNLKKNIKKATHRVINQQIADITNPVINHRGENIISDIILDYGKLYVR